MNMKTVIYSACFLLCVSMVLAVNPVNPVVPSGSIAITSYPILSVVGATGLGVQGDGGSSSANAQNFQGPSRLKTVPGSLVSTGPYQYGGLQVGDSSFRRSLFFRNPITQINAQATSVFMEPSFTETGQPPLDSSPNFVDVAVSRDDVIFADQDRLLLFNITAYTFTNGLSPPPPAQQFVNIVLGTCTTCNYAPISFGGVNSVAADMNRVYLGVRQPCAQVLVWQHPISSNNANAAYSLGAPLSTDCANNPCTAASTQTCFTPGAMDVDCYGGLWVFDSTTKTVLYFASGTKTSTFSFSAPAGFSFTNAPPTSLAWSTKRCNILALSTASLSSSIQFLFSVTFSGVTPTAVSVMSAFGGGTTVGATTSNIGPVQGLAWDITNPDYLWVSDQINYRVIQFTPFGSQAVSQTIIPSQTGTPSITPTRSATISLSITRTPSVTTSPSSGASQSLSSVPSESATFSPSPVYAGSESESSVPAESEAGTTGPASSLDCWLSHYY